MMIMFCVDAETEAVCPGRVLGSIHRIRKSRRLWKIRRKRFRRKRKWKIDRCSFYFTS